MHAPLHRGRLSVRLERAALLAPLCFVGEGPRLVEPRGACRARVGVGWRGKSGRVGTRVSVRDRGRDVAACNNQWKGPIGLCG